MELESAVMLSVLLRLDAQSVPMVWEKLSLRTGDVMMSLGQKRLLAQEARSVLSCAMKQPAADPALVELAAKACEVDLELWNSLADEIVSFRNSHLGHGFQLPPALERSTADGFVPQAEKFVGLLPYLNRNMLVYLESRKMTKTATECVFRMLVHDNQIFPSNPICQPKGSRLDGLDEQEVYLNYAEPDGFLSLWPWVLFAPSGTTADAMWFFDGTKNGVGVFKSTLAPGAIHTDSLAGAQALKLIGERRILPSSGARGG
jgi:hypothetical protein